MGAHDSRSSRKFLPGPDNLEPLAPVSSLMPGMA